MENFKSEIAIKLDNILRKISGSRNLIEDKTRLYHDLKISGDDVTDLIREIRQVFGVSLQELDSPRYFPDEGTVICWWLISFMTNRTPLNPSNYEEISVERICAAIENGGFVDN